MLRVTQNQLKKLQQNLKEKLTSVEMFSKKVKQTYLNICTVETVLRRLHLCGQKKMHTNVKQQHRDGASDYISFKTRDMLNDSTAIPAFQRRVFSK